MFLLKPYQHTAVQKLTDAACNLLADSARRQSILLHAPTGAGKTVIMAAAISALTEEVKLRPGLPRNVAYVWMAPQTLHKQSYTSLTGFYEAARDLQTLQVEDLESGQGLPPASLLFLNWAGVDKDKNTFRRENERGFNLDTVMLQTRAAGTEVIVIIDEAHVSAFSGEQAKKVLEILDGKIEIHVTATPPQRHFTETVRIPRKDVTEAEMIKKGVRINPDVRAEEQTGREVELYLLEKALQKGAEIAAAYEAAGSFVKPLLLIQLPSEIQALSDEDRRLKTVLESYLETTYDISVTNGRLAIWLSDAKDKQNKEGIERIDAPQQVLIFKQAIALGWDCPRAAVLLTFRELGRPESSSFGIQTVGRILRMPEQKHYDDETLDNGWVYTNIQNNIIRIVPDDADYIATKEAYRREGLVFPCLAASNLVNDRETPGFLTRQFKKQFFLLAEKKYGILPAPEEDLFSGVTAEAKAVQEGANKAALAAHFWDMAVEDIEITIPADLTVDPYEERAIQLQPGQQEEFVKTQAQLSDMLDAFCYGAVTSLNKAKSWKTLRETLIEFAEYYPGIWEHDARKWLLHGPNNQLLVSLINEALESYGEWQRAQGNKHRRRIETEWTVPEKRSYAAGALEHDDVDTHALEPFYEYKPSTPERDFVALLESHADSLEWWYKNGDKGKEHFAITYTDAGGREAVFYPDFILRWKSGAMGIFDTKSAGSDPNATHKHAALIGYLESRRQADTRGRWAGGIILKDERLQGAPFRFSHALIENTTDLAGWETFDPRNYN